MTVPPPATQNKQEVVRSVSVGQRVAEEERDALATYFVETEQWRRVYEGEADIVFAPKGGGKSAIYSMLVARESELLGSGVLLAPGETPDGATAFAEIKSEPPTSENEFVGVWKLYFLTLVSQVLREYGFTGGAASELADKLAQAGLTPEVKQKRRMVRTVMGYVARYFRPNGVEGSVALDPATGMPVLFTGKIAFDEPNEIQRANGALYVDELFEIADRALVAADYEVWLVLDRLDVAFAETAELEENALRALFRAYSDMRPLRNIRLKIFLRSDIWRAITEKGFREASHITRELTLVWNETSLMQLIVQRLLQSADLCQYYAVDPQEILSDTQKQRGLFDLVYPPQVDAGSRKSKTFDWALGRTRGGDGVTAPRELIHLLSLTRDRQLTRFDLGEPEPPGKTLFDKQALKDALYEVSTVRLTKTLFAEYPTLKGPLEALEGQKTHQSVESLAGIWKISQADAAQLADRLVDIGFFEPRGDRKSRTYWVPFMYRPALKLVQGSADGVTANPDSGEEDD